MLALFVLVAVVVASTSHRAVNSGTTVVRSVSCTHLAAIAWGRGPTNTALLLPQTHCLQLWSAEPGRADLPSSVFEGCSTRLGP